MPNPPTFDLAAAHRFFAADCFNRAWTLIDTPNRSAEDDEQMLRLSQASMWHWTQRPDCTPRNLSIGYWQLARVYALAGRADEARRYGQLCLQHSQSEAPFYQAYAHEALARADHVAGNHDRAAQHIAEARRLAEAVAEADDRQRLLDDLAAIGA